MKQRKLKQKITSLLLAAAMAVVSFSPFSTQIHAAATEPPASDPAVMGAKARAGERTIYYDSTLSKVAYSGNDGQTAGKVIRKPNSIPSTASGSTVYYYAWKSTDSSDNAKGEMSKEPPFTQGANTWADVWSVNLDDAYDRIVFADYPVLNPSDYQTGGTCTTELTIPSNLTSPCFYADNGDQCVYEQQWMYGQMISDNAQMHRDGSWDEVHKITTRGNDLTSYAASGTETRDSHKLYVNTTFFDYFSDKELNGVDRGSIQKSSTNPPVLGYTNRTYIPHKLFNTALSDYYRGHNVANPLYFGHFQWKFNSDGTYFKSIANDLNLFGYDDRDKFYHINNPEYRKGHTECNEDENQNGHSHPTDAATQGLADSSLSSGGELQMSGAKAPFFDKAFLEGENSCNTALGKVYPSVSFPFTKENDYWTFNSKETTLRMAQSTRDDHYFLQEKSSYPVRGYTNGLPTVASNFFPFDDDDSSGRVNELNYGFGMKMDINFRLTQDGTVKDSSGAVKPITFNFSGDDDVWVFIDGKLALDIGGCHGEVSGKLDFSTKTATVSKAKTDTGEQTDVTTPFTLEGDNTDQHTLTMYYMERGLWESNMCVTFNFADNNVFSAEQEVDTAGIDRLFTSNADFAANVKNLAFDFDIKNLAAHYGTCTVAEMDALASMEGFLMRQEHISDYGSVASKTAETANGAKYSLFSKGADGSETLAGAPHGNTVTNGVLSLKDKQIARFTDKFRRGSYIVVTEKTSSMMENLSGLSGSAAEKLLADVFDVKYSISSKNTEIPQADLQADTDWVAGGSLSSVKNQPGTTANDGRTEKFVADATDMNGATIPHTSGLTKPENAVLFRNYGNPDSETVDIDLNVKYTNRFKSGVIAIKLEQAAGSEPLDKNINYGFTITFDNIAGLKLEDTWDASGTAATDNKISQNFLLKTGESKVFTDVPAGTEYTIGEITPATDGSVPQSVTDSLADGTTHAGVGRDTVAISDDQVVTGKIAADDTAALVQTFTFCQLKEKTPEHTHAFGAEWMSDSNGHWHECACGEKSDAADHTEDGGRVTKAPTETEAGVRTYTCSVCGYILRTEEIEKLPPASTETPQKTVTSEEIRKNSEKLDSGISIGWNGNKFALSWGKTDGAEGYDICVAPCGKTKLNAKSLIRTVKGKKTSLSFAKIAGRKISGKNVYKVKIKAWRYVNGKKVYIGSSRGYHVAGKAHTKYTNAKKLKPAKKKYVLKKGKEARIRITVAKQSKKKKLLPSSHGPALRYTSSNKKIATVTQKGKIKAKKEGICYITVTALNGIRTKIKITVKQAYRNPKRAPEEKQ